MSKTTITPAQAQELKDGGFSLAEIVEQYDIDLTAGAAQVTASAAQPTVQVNEALLAQAEELFNQGRKAKNTKSGRLVRVLGRVEGIAPYSIVVYRDKK